MKRQKKIDKLEDNNLVLIAKIDASRKSGRTLEMTRLKRKLKLSPLRDQQSKGQISKLKENQLLKVQK